VSDETTEEKVSVLIIDDEPAVGDALRLVFESAGYEVEWAETGRKGVKLATAKRFRVGIVDLVLPDMSGLQVIKTIRAQQPEMLLILITGTGSPMAFSEARRLGVVGILTKPFSPADIVKLINRTLEREISGRINPSPQS
jgi:DNA-binding NtrC family response regulator